MKNDLDLVAGLPITKVTNNEEPTMFTSVSSRSASAYQRVNVETAVSEATPYQLVKMMLDSLILNIGAARVAMGRGDIVVKCEKITKAVRILDEGLKPALNLAQGGELASNLNNLYAYCLYRLTEANMSNNDAALAEVLGLMEPLADGWSQISGQVATEVGHSH